MMKVKDSKTKEKIAKFLYYVEEMYLDDIAQILGLTKGRVHQIITRNIGRSRKRKRKEDC